LLVLLQLSEVIRVGFAFIFRFSFLVRRVAFGTIAFGGSSRLLFFFLGNGLACLLILPGRFAGSSAPSLLNLFVGVAVMRY
jgi:hypothetical protein